MTTTTSSTSIDDERTYRDLLQNVQNRLVTNVAGNAPLFTTDTTELYTLFLDALPASERQHNNCSACRQFVNRYGGLAVIDADGNTQSAVWHPDDAPMLYQPSIAAMNQAIKRAKITGVFYNALTVWGQPVTGPWHHLAVRPPA